MKSQQITLIPDMIWYAILAIVRKSSIVNVIAYQENPPHAYLLSTWAIKCSVEERVFAKQLLEFLCNWASYFFTQTCFSKDVRLLRDRIISRPVSEGRWKPSYTPDVKNVSRQPLVAWRRVTWSGPDVTGSGHVFANAMRAERRLLRIRHFLRNLRSGHHSVSCEVIRILFD